MTKVGNASADSEGALAPALARRSVRWRLRDVKCNECDEGMRGRRAHVSENGSGSDSTYAPADNEPLVLRRRTDARRRAAVLLATIRDPNILPPVEHRHLSLRCSVGRDYDPVQGQWYQDLEDNEIFQVLSVDPDEEIIELQYENGDIEEIDLDTWRELDLEETDEPEGWSSDEFEADEDDEDDLGDDWDDDDDDWDDEDDFDDDYGDRDDL